MSLSADKRKPLIGLDDEVEGHAKRAKPLPRRIKLVFALPQLFVAAVAVTMSTTLLTVYTQRKVGTSFIAIVQFVSGLVASYLQLILGYLGDRTQSKYGRRRPYIALGFPVTCFSAAMLYIVPSGGLSASAWFAVWYSLFVIFREFMMVPLNALATELTQDDDSRKSLYAYTAGGNVIGLIIGATLQTVAPLEIGVPVVCVLIAVTMTLMLAVIRENPEFIAHGKHALPLIPGIRSCMQNKQWLILMVSGTTVSLINEIVAVFQLLLQYIFDVDPKTHIIILMLPYIAAQGLFVPVVYLMSTRLGKIVTWKIGAFIIVAYGISGFFMTGVSMYAFMATVFLFGAGLAATNLTLNVFTSDTIDYDELLTGKRRESTYHSVGNLPSLFFSTAGKAVPLIVLSATGFKSGAATQPKAALLAIRGMVTLFPAAVLIAAICLFSAYKLSEKKHDQIMDGIEAFGEGRVPTDPFTGLPVVRETLLASAAVEHSRTSSRHLRLEPVDISTYLLYFTPNDVRMLASRWRRRVVTKFIGATTMWGIDTALAVWASVVLLLKGHQQVAFIGLTLGTLFSIAFSYELSRLKGVKWVLSQTKNDLVGYARAYMYINRRQSSAALQMGGVEGGAASEAALYDERSSSSLAAQAKGAVQVTSRGFAADRSSERTQMGVAIARFSLIHIFCCALCIVTLIVSYSLGETAKAL